MQIFVIFISLLFISPLAAETILEGNFTQGGLVYGKTKPGNIIKLEKRKLRISSSGSFVFGFSRDTKKGLQLMIDMPHGLSETRTIEVEQRKYRVQRINGLPNDMISPPKKVLERIIIENKKIKKVRMRDSNFSFWKSGFVWPAKGRISGVYGSQRILNGRPKQPHYGIDIAAPTGGLVVAPTGGVVDMAEPDLYYSGGTIILDHGHGLTSAFLHMDKLFVVVGDVVSKSQAIGTIGSTGRSTGPHLDWRINWFEKRIDPGLLVE